MSTRPACFFCKNSRSAVSNCPERGSWTCIPCYYFLVNSPHKWSLAWKEFHTILSVQSNLKNLIRFLVWTTTIPKVLIYKWRRQ